MKLVAIGVAAKQKAALVVAEMVRVAVETAGVVAEMVKVAVETAGAAAAILVMTRMREAGVMVLQEAAALAAAGKVAWLAE